MIRVLSRSTQVVIDLVILSLAFWLAFLIRFEWPMPYLMWKRLMFTWPYTVAFQYVVLYLFRIPRFAWRYVGLRETSQILKAIVVGSTVLLIIRLIAGRLQFTFGYALYALIPLGVIGIDFTLAFLGITGVRVLRRVTVERQESDRRRVDDVVAVPTLLIGAGQAGVMVAKEIESRPDLGIFAIGFIDDDPAKMGSTIHGVSVIGTTNQLVHLCKKYGALQAIITIASAPGSEIRRIARLCEEAKIPTKIIPGIYEIVGGKVNMSRIRKVAIEDLLGREPVNLDEDAISAVVRGRIVMMTGAGGSIGAELCRQICRFGPATLVLVEQAENNLFQIHRELVEKYPELDLKPCIADICDAPRMEAIFKSHRPSVVFHAAAHKHVPMMEWNPGEAVKNNIFGTRTLADLANAHGVVEFVMISTDKAVNPTSTMGVCKRVAEIYIQALSQVSKTRFVTVRFGNVLGSTGSVIPIFQEQISRGGPVTVTHPDMKRYFMTIPEACQLVLQAATMGKGGEIFILDMGSPVEIVELARDLIRLSGFKPDEDIEIRFTGVRPGEKLYEELVVAEENADKTRHPKIFVGRLSSHPLEVVNRQLVALRDLESTDAATIRSRLSEIVPEYKPFTDAPEGDLAAARTGDQRS